MISASFRSPDWLWTQCEHNVPAKPISFFPPSMRRGTRFSRRLRLSLALTGRAPHTDFDPPFSAAFELYSSDPPLQDELESRLVAGQTIAEISHAMALRAPRLTVEALGLYERYFFDVRDRLGADDWLHLEVIGVWPNMDSQPTRRMVWMMMARYAGVCVLEELVEALTSPAATETVRRHADQAEWLVRDFANAWRTRAEVRAHQKRGRELFASAVKSRPFQSLMLKFVEQVELRRGGRMATVHRPGSPAEGGLAPELAKMLMDDIHAVRGGVEASRGPLAESNAPCAEESAQHSDRGRQRCPADLHDHCLTSGEVSRKHNPPSSRALTSACTQSAAHKACGFGHNCCKLINPEMNRRRARSASVESR